MQQTAEGVPPCEPHETTTRLAKPVDNVEDPVQDLHEVTEFDYTERECPLPVVRVVYDESGDHPRLQVETCGEPLYVEYEESKYLLVGGECDSCGPTWKVSCALGHVLVCPDYQASDDFSTIQADVGLIEQALALVQYGMAEAGTAQAAVVGNLGTALFDQEDLEAPRVPRCPHCQSVNLAHDWANDVDFCRDCSGLSRAGEVLTNSPVLDATNRAVGGTVGEWMATGLSETQAREMSSWVDPMPRTGEE